MFIDDVVVLSIDEAENCNLQSSALRSAFSPCFPAANRVECSAQHLWVAPPFSGFLMGQPTARCMEVADSLSAFVASRGLDAAVACNDAGFLYVSDPVACSSVASTINDAVDSFLAGNMMVCPATVPSTVATATKKAPETAPPSATAAPQTPEVAVVAPPTGGRTATPTVAGASTLPMPTTVNGVPLEAVFQPGAKVVIDQGNVNEESNIIVGFGGAPSARAVGVRVMLLAHPLQYDHAAGASVMPVGEAVAAVPTSFQLLFLASCAVVAANEAAFKSELEASLLTLCEAEAECTVDSISWRCSGSGASDRFEATVATTSNVGFALMGELVPDELTFGVYGNVIPLPTTRIIEFDYGGTCIILLERTP